MNEIDSSILTPLNRRTRNKAARLARIVDSARQVFRTNGYNGASLKEIADAADTGTATLFSYARDKRDLLMMVVNADLDTITETSFASIPAGLPLVDQLLYVFEARFRYLAIDPDLSRNVVYQAIEDDRGAQTVRYNARRELMGRLVANLVDEQKTAGVIPRRIDSAVLARLLIDVYLGENRRWLALRDPRVDDALRELRTVFEMALFGIIKRKL
jgi:AcrR family transcriptional regulator